MWPETRKTITAAMLVAVTLLCCAASMVVVSEVLPLPLGKRWDLASLYLFASIFVMTYPAIRCARALRCLTADRPNVFHDVPEAIIVLCFVGLLVFRASEPMTPVFGKLTKSVTLLIAWFSSLTVLGFIAAGARVDRGNELSEGRHPGATIATIVHHLGGGLGSMFAEIVFKDSEVFKTKPVGFPKLFGALLLIGVFVFAARSPLISPAYWIAPLPPEPLPTYPETR